MRFNCGGVSLIGKHATNQDYYISRRFEWGAVAVVSDGLGSKVHADVGAKAACEAVLWMAEKHQGIVEGADRLLRLIHENWLERLKGYNANDCCATCLLCIINNNELFAAQLGDGFIGVVSDNGVSVLCDDKSDHFANETDSLDECFQPEFWRTLAIGTAAFASVILSTDGIGIGDGTSGAVGDFCKDFYLGYKNEKPDNIESDVRRWLLDWNGSDDKTIAFVMRERHG